MKEKYAFLYRGGSHPQTPQEQDAEMAKWYAWFEGMGDAVADMGNPLGYSYTVHPDGEVSDDRGKDHVVSGISFVCADDLEAAIALARGCPILASGGTVEVAKAVDLAPPAES